MFDKHLKKNYRLTFTFVVDSQATLNSIIIVYLFCKEKMN